MPTINITEEASRALRGLATKPFRDTGTRRADGTIDVPVEEETVERLSGCAMPGETASDTIIRLAAFHRSGGKAN